MNLKKTFSGLMTNKYFLYFIVFLSATNIIGYLTMNNNDAVIFFALVGFLMFNFSKNMTIVLLVSVISTNLFMVSKPFRTMEGFKEGNKPARIGIGGSGADGGVSGGLSEAGSFTNMGDTKEEGKEESTEPTEEKEEPKSEDNKPTPPATTTEVKQSFTNKLSPAPVKKSSHIDYATTLEDAYKNLEKMLGTGGLQNLTADTKKLMEQQTQLFNSMENIAPLLSQAQKMMKGMDVDQLNKFASTAKSFNKSDA
jgi:hypothetical protein